MGPWKQTTFMRRSTLACRMQPHQGVMQASKNTIAASRSLMNGCLRLNATPQAMRGLTTRACNLVGHQPCPGPLPSVARVRCSPIRWARFAH